MHDHSANAAAASDPIITLSDPRLTKEQRQRALTLLNGTRAALAAFPDEASLVAAGYRSIGDGRKVGSFEHFVNSAYMADGNELDPLHIESIVTQRQDDGTKKIARPCTSSSRAPRWRRSPRSPAILTPWHNHDNLCWQDGKVVGLYVAGKCLPRGEFRGATPPMIHVWLEDTPCGPFTGIEGHGGSNCAHSAPPPDSPRARLAPEKSLSTATTHHAASFLRCSCTAPSASRTGPSRERRHSSRQHPSRRHSCRRRAGNSGTARSKRRHFPVDTPATEPPTVEAPEPDVAPVAAQPAPAPAPTAAPQPEPVATVAASEPHRRGVFVPVWVGAVILVLAVAALGFGIGRWTADDSTNRSTAIANNGGIVPQLPSGNGRNGNGNNGNNGNRNNGGSNQTPSTGTAFLGVATQNATGGVEVVTVGTSTPAASAGLKEGDVITAIDNTSVTTTTALRAAIQSHTVGDTVTIHYTRNGQASTVKVTLGTHSTSQTNPN